MAISSNPTSRQLHVSLAENHRCDPVVRLRITSGLLVTQPLRRAGATWCFRRSVFESYEKPICFHEARIGRRFSRDTWPRKLAWASKLRHDPQVRENSLAPWRAEGRDRWREKHRVPSALASPHIVQSICQCRGFHRAGSETRRSRLLLQN